MHASEILREAEHRPWPVPKTPWILRQNWEDLLFAHWPLPPQQVAEKLPLGLTLDTYDGQAWIGVVPFIMTGVRPRFVPPLPYVSRFYELNVRTYVTANNRPGVYFFSLDASNPLAVVLARAFFFLPYYHARFRCRRQHDAITYVCERHDPRSTPASFAATYAPTGPVFTSRPGSLEHFLTERYCLYSESPSGRLYEGDILHRRWPLQPAEASISRNTMTLPAGLALPDTPPLLHFSRRVEMLAWPVLPVQSPVMTPPAS